MKKNKFFPLLLIMSVCLSENVIFADSAKEVKEKPSIWKRVKNTLFGDEKISVKKLKNTKEVLSKISEKYKNKKEIQENIEGSNKIIDEEIKALEKKPLKNNKTTKKV